MKKTIFAAAIVASMFAAGMVSAAPPAPQDDSTIVAVYPADIQRVGSEVLVRVETVKSRNSVSYTKVYVREDAVPADLLADIKK